MSMKILDYTQFSNLSESEEEKSYTFDELSPEAKQNAIDLNRDRNTEYDDWWQPIIEGFVEEMEEIGMTNVECEFSGFYSQGDGASFTGEVNDNDKFLKSVGINLFYPELIGLGNRLSNKIETVVNEISENIRITIERYNSRHYHYNTISANVEIIGDDDIEFDLGLDKIMEISVSDICEKIEPIITDWAREKSKELYRNLENSYEELRSDETISSDLESGGYTFDENGNII